MSKKKSAAEYAALVRALRPFTTGFTAANGIDLRIPLTPAQKGKITRYANEIRDLTSRENYPLRARNKQHLKIAQDVAQHSPGFPGIKVAFIPWTKPLGSKVATPKIKFKTSGLIIDTPNYQKQFIPFNKKKIITHTDLEIARVIAQAPPGAKFQIQAGKYQMGDSHSSMSLGVEVKKLMARYDGKQQVKGSKRGGNGKKKWNPKDHDFRKWLNGVTAYKFKAGGAGNNAPRLLRAQTESRQQSAETRKQARAEYKKYQRELKKGKDLDTDLYKQFGFNIVHVISTRGKRK